MIGSMKGYDIMGKKIQGIDDNPLVIKQLVFGFPQQTNCCLPE